MGPGVGRRPDLSTAPLILSVQLCRTQYLQAFSGLTPLPGALHSPSAPLPSELPKGRALTVLTSSTDGCPMNVGGRKGERKGKKEGVRVREDFLTGLPQFEL